jgi:hypothetical protein
MVPIIRYMILCENVRIDSDRPTCTHVECLMSNIVSEADPPFPLLREMICVFLVLTDCRGQGTAQIRVSFVDGEQEQPLFGTPLHQLDFSGRSPLDSLGIVFRLQDCRFPHAGLYSVQFWYNGQKLEECPIRLR